MQKWGDPSKPAIMLVHGLGHNAANDWKHLAPELSKHYYVVTFDLPGFGRSGKENNLYSPDNYARFVQWIADTYIQKRFTLIGHSMGGAIALNYASKYSHKIDRLILIDAAGILHRTAFTKHLIDEYKPTWWWDILPATNTEKITALLGFNLEELDKFPMALDLILSTSFTRRTLLGGNPVKIAGLALMQHDFSGQLERVSVPTFIIWGENDNIAPLRTGKLLVNRIPNASLEIIIGAKHTPMLETPGLLNKLVLAELQAPPSSSKDLKARQKNTSTDKTFNCIKQKEQYISGEFDLVNIVDCQRIVIENAKIDYLTIKRSSVEIINSSIGSGKAALKIDDSILLATATDFQADIPIIVNNSRLDFAGVNIIAYKRPYKTTTQSTVLYSVSSLTSPNNTKHLHGVYILEADQDPL